MGVEDCFATQLIDGDGGFNAAGLDRFVKEAKLADCGLSYAVVAIMGPQSSGKSTLMNHLFHTKFREMDAFRGRSQTTKGIWIAKCVGIEPCTIGMDLEGTDGRERGEDDTTFEKQSALFALAVSDIVLINMWCHDIGREQAANKPLLKTVFQVMMRLFSPRKTTLLFVIRDKTKTPFEYLEPVLREDIQKIWDSVPKPQAHKSTPLSEFFTVEVVALSSYEEKEEKFKEEVGELRQHFFHSISPGGLAGDRRGVVPASGFSFSAQHIWKVIKENKDLDLPAHKVMVATVRCEEIANEKFSQLTSSEDWLALKEAVESGPVPGFGKQLTSILDTYFSEYDMEAIYFDEGVRNSRRHQLESRALDFVFPAYTAMLGHLRSKALENFKVRIEHLLNKGEGFASSVQTSTERCMVEFDRGCADAAVQQANWDTSKVREKLRRDIDAHATSVRTAKLLELNTSYEKKLSASLTEPVEALLDAGGKDTWASIRKLLNRETEAVVSDFSKAVAGFELDKETIAKMVQHLRAYARNVVEKKAREEAGKVLIHMKDRFSTVFNYDSDSMPRVWTGKEDIRTITKDARSAALKILSVRAAIRLDEKPDNIEKVIFSSLMDGTGTVPSSQDNKARALTDPLAISTWEEVPSEDTLISPAQCKSLWKQFKSETEYTVTQAIAAQEANMSLSVNVSIIDLLIGKLVEILENEVTTIDGVRDEVDSVKQELLYMQAFLKDAEANKAKTEGEKLWVASIRDLSHEVEDTIDEFMYYMYEKQSGSRLSRWVHKTIHIPKKIQFRRKTAEKLQKISEKIKVIPERNQRYGVGRVGAAMTCDNTHNLVQNQAETSFFIMEDELVGIEAKKQILVGWLMQEEKHQTVVSVVGMGGSGKTTLVAKVFTSECVKRHFDSYAWITVSQTYALEDLFRSLIMELHKSRKESLPENLKDMSRRELLEILVNYLESKRYLVVLDDVWDISVWREIRVSLQDRHLGSRVIITTRNEKVASDSFGVESHIHHIQPLLENEAWELFSKKAFSTNRNKTCPPELNMVARELVEKCGGLPLAIVAIGGLMSSKESRDQWRQVYDNLNWHLQSESLLDPVKAILLLSFDDLSSQLKHCFLYCSLFPEDYVIARTRIIRMWIAEGFVEHVKGVAPEDVADGYLMELCFRSMLQVEERNDQGRPRRVKMHDLIRELALATCENEKFGLVYDGREVMGDTSVRRLSIHTSGGNIVELCKGMSRISSLLVFATDMSSLSVLNDLLSRFIWLKTLDLEDVKIDELPDTTVYLFNLRYLNLKGTRIQELPESIRHLRNLLYLNIRETLIGSIPQGITKLLNLRHLLMYSQSRNVQVFNRVTGTKASSDICKLQQLQSLLVIESEGDVIKLVGNLSQIRKIGISNVNERDEIDLWVSIEKMTQLRSLFLFASNEEEILPVNEQCPPLPHLRRLGMSGKLQRVIPWFSSVQSLTGLWLSWSRLEDDLLPHIEALPNLTRLGLNNAYIGKELCFRKGFVKLVNLWLGNFAALEKITIGKGAIPNLRILSLIDCMELSTLPLGLENLSNLQSLNLMNVPTEIVQPIRKGGVDRSKVQHIPQIGYSYKESSEWVSENLT